jgi:hypothetical protein
MEFKERFSDYKERYYKELDARDKVESRQKASFSIFLVVFALIAFLFNKTLGSAQLPSDVFFWAFYGVGVLAFLVAIVFYIKGIHGYSYALVPTPEELEKYRKEIYEHYSKTNLGLAKQWMEEAYEQYIFECYISYTSQNTKNNDTKALNASHSMSSLIAAFVFICLSYVPYYASTFHGEKNDSTATTTATAPPEQASKGTTTTTNKASKTELMYFVILATPELTNQLRRAFAKSATAAY